MFPKPASKLEETVSFIEDSLVRMNNKTDIYWVILNNDNNEFLGCCGLHLKDNAKEPEFGIWLKKSAHGQKYGHEAIMTIADWAKNNIDFNHFIYPVDKDNIPSRRIPESLGGVIINEERVKTMNNSFLNLIIFKITK